MTKEQLDLIREHAPYVLCSDGVLVDEGGVALCSLRPHPTSEETPWDRAVVALLNAAASGDLGPK